MRQDNPVTTTMTNIIIDSGNVEACDVAQPTSSHRPSAKEVCLFLSDYAVTLLACGPHAYVWKKTSTEWHARSANAWK